MKRLTHYEAVQVLERWPDGRLKAWYGGEHRASLKEATADAKTNAEEFPNTRFQVIETIIVEHGPALVGIMKARPIAS